MKTMSSAIFANLLSILAVTIASVGLETTYVHAQGEPRYYLRFDDSNPVDYQGFRIKKDPSDTAYWILGRRDADYSTGVAFVCPLTTATVSNKYDNATPPPHSHFFSSSTPNPRIWHPCDFDINPTTPSSITITALQELYTGDPAVVRNPALSLFTVDNTLSLSPATSYDFHMSNRTEETGSAIYLDGATGDYLVAWNLIDPATVGGGTNLLDFGMARITPGNPPTVVWQFAFSGNPANQYEDVRAAMVDANGDYVVCGRRTDFTNARQGGLVTKVDNTGLLIWQKEYHAGAGTYTEFNSISESVTTGEYVAVGTTYTTGNPTGQKKVIIVGINRASGAVNWSKICALSGNDAADAEAFRHIQMPDREICIAGRVTHGNGNTSGMLLKVVNPSITSVTCSGGGGTPFIHWWNEYMTYDPVNDGYTNTELIDVAQIAGNSSRLVRVNDDVAAVGTAQVYHADQNATPHLIKDVLLLETTTTVGVGGSPDIHGVCHTSTYCLDYTPEHECEDITLTVVNLKPTPEESFSIQDTEMSSATDTYFRICETAGTSQNDLDDTTATKTASEDSGEGTYEAGNSWSLWLSPNPTAGENVTVHLKTPYSDVFSCSIYDMNGVERLKGDSRIVHAGDRSIDLNCRALENGLYVVRVKSTYFCTFKMFSLVR